MSLPLRERGLKGANMTSGEKLKAIRLQKGISQTELIKLSGFPRSTVQAWEYGDRELVDVKKIKLLADILGVDFKDLI